jgi:O-antigen/teichoic acid export membrane protein
MSFLKKLAGESVIYGLSSIVGRFLNYLLVPLYTAVMPATSGEYGVVNNMYGYTAIILILLTFGMETTFFRWANKEGADVRKIYSSAMLVVGMISACFLAMVFGGLTPIADALGYAAHPEYVGIMALIVAVDAVSCIPFVYLRYQHKAVKFAALKFLNIAVNIGLNLFVFLACPAIHKAHPESIAWFYDPEYQAGYVFAINLVCTLVVSLLLWKEFRFFRWGFDGKVIRSMLVYAYPIAILGVAGVVNQAADKILMPFLIPGKEGLVQLGIYNAASKIAMIMAMATQAFRYAYEPIVFGAQKDKSDTVFVNVQGTKYFIIFSLMGFLLVMAWLDPLKELLIRNADYWEGIRVVPIVMVAEIFMGIYFNFSFWYKLIDQTLWGALFSFIGCAVLVAIYVLFVPVYGYIACAWAGVAGYGTCMLLSYFIGQKKNPIPYDMKSAFFYAALTAVLYVAMAYQPVGGWWGAAVNTLAVALFAYVVIQKEWGFAKLLSRFKK